MLGDAEVAAVVAVAPDGRVTPLAILTTAEPIMQEISLVPDDRERTGTPSDVAAARIGDDDVRVLLWPGPDGRSEPVAVLSTPWIDSTSCSMPVPSGTAGARRRPTGRWSGPIGTCGPGPSRRPGVDWVHLRTAGPSPIRRAVALFSTVEMLAEQPFLAGLTEHQLSLLVPATGRSMFHAGNRIFHQGTPADRFWIITHGEVFLDSEVPGRDNVVLETLKPGAVLGWSWLFPPYRWHFGATAVITTHTITFDAAMVRALFQRDPAVGYELTTRFLQVMGDRLQSARRRIEILHRGATPARWTAGGRAAPATPPR